MPDNLCESACADLGAWGQMLALLAFVARWVWAETRRRQAERDRQGLQEQVRDLSQRPPERIAIPIDTQGGLTLKFPGYSLSPSPYPEGAQDSLPPKSEGPDTR